MKPALSRRFVIGAAAALALAFAACEMPLLAGGSSSTETGKKIQYLGRVANGSGEGIPGVIVALEGSKLADTTDLTGSFRVSGRSKTAQQTLRFSLHGQTLARKTDLGLQAEIPEMRFVQRGFSGRIHGDANRVARIEGVVTGDGIAPGDSMKAAFYHNVLAENFSGFVYFPAPESDTVLAYAVRVDVFDSAGVRIAQSAGVSFNSLAGNVVIQDLSLNKAAASR